MEKSNDSGGDRSSPLPLPPLPSGEGQDARRRKPPKKSTSSNAISSLSSSPHKEGSHSSGGSGSSSPNMRPIKKTKRKSVSLSGTPRPNQVADSQASSSPPSVTEGGGATASTTAAVPAATGIVDLERKRSRRKKTQASPSFKEEEEALETSRSLPGSFTSPALTLSSSSNGDSLIDSDSATITPPMTGKPAHGASAPNSPSPRKKSLEIVVERLHSKESPPPSARRSSVEEDGSLSPTPPRAVSPRDTRLGGEGFNPPPPLVIPRRRRDSEHYAPTSPHPLRNSFTHDDIVKLEQAAAEPGLPEGKIPPKKNSLSGIQEVTHEDATSPTAQNSSSAAKPLTTVEKLKLSGVWIS